MTPMQSRERFKRSTKKGRGAIGALILVLLGFGAAVGVSGCTPQETTPPPTPSPTSVTTTPALPTNEEALAIVEELVPKFLAAEAKAVQSGDYADLERLAAAPYVDTVRTGAANLEANGQRLVGVPVVTNFTIQSVTDEKSIVAISSYACQDISAVDVVDVAGNNVQPSDLGDRSTLVYKVVSEGDSFVVEEVEAWSGEGSC